MDQNAGGERAQLPTVSCSFSLGSKGNELVELLNGMGTDNKIEAVVQNMEKFINIGTCLGYNMADCVGTKNKLISRMGAMEVDR